MVVDLRETQIDRSRVMEERILGESEGRELKTLNPGLPKKIMTVNRKGTCVDRLKNLRAHALERRKERRHISVVDQ
jgi:hypothetical protein